LKKIANITLIFILLGQSGGLMLLYKMQQWVVQFEMQKTMENNETEFQKLTLTISDFEKSKINEHEISYKGKMYDFKSAVFTGDSVELLVINDTEEEGILGEIEKFTENINKQNSEFPNHLIKLLSLVYVCPEPGNKFFFECSNENTFVPFGEEFSSPVIERASPPPKLV
jgi:hypothetical protein